MPRRIDHHPDLVPDLRRTPDRDQRLRGWLQAEIQAALSSRYNLEQIWKEARRQYEAVPRLAHRNSPIPDSPNIEIPIGAIATDSIYAVAIEALFTASPLLIVRPTREDRVDHAKAMQRWVNWMAANEVKLRYAVMHAFLDDVQLGTAAYYIPFVERKRKTDLARIVDRQPEIIPIAPEDLLLPPNAPGDIQEARWVGIRFFYSLTDVQDRAIANSGWDISKAMPVAHVDQQRRHRQDAAHISGPTTVSMRELFEFIDVYCYFDYNEDGEAEDLLVTFDRASNNIIALGYAPYDRRPIEKIVYQPRAHLPYGLGVMEMIRPFQQEVTDLHNYKILNSLLANCRHYIVGPGAEISETAKFWPSKVSKVGDVNQFLPVQMADVHPSLAIFEQAGLALAEQRVGLRGELALLARGGSRTPATTALALLQQTNRRFTPAFDEMRLGTAAAVRQAVWRYSERVKEQGEDFAELRSHFADVLGPADAQLLIEVLQDDDFTEAVSVEFTAASATVSREADRQNALLLANFLAQQQQRTLELMGIATNEQLPEPLRKTAVESIRVNNEIADRLLRTFDQVRDPARLIPNTQAELTQLEDEMEADKQMAQMAAALLGGGAMGGNGIAPAAVAPPAAGELIPGIA